MTQPEVRIGDVEREAAVSALGEHYLAGRLTKEEYDERTSVAWGAKTNSQLWPLFADLPALRPKNAAVPAQTPRTARRGSKSKVPLLPLLLVIVAVLAITNVPWWVWLIVVWMWLSGMFTRMRHWHR